MSPAAARLAVAPARQDFAFLGILAASVVASWAPFTTVLIRSFSRGDAEHYSHIILLPFVTGYLIWSNRERIFGDVGWSFELGIPLMVVGAAGIVAARVTTSHPENMLALAMLGLVIVWAGAFATCYGRRAFALAGFPLALLLFMVPLPPVALDALIVFLQRASTEVTAIIFSLIGMPSFRQGYTFALANITIEVARECSGIRSCLALMISGSVMSYILLRAAWTRTVLILVILPLAIVKNAFRIVGLSWLAVHVDPGFVTGSALHKNGGIPFFIASITVLATIAWLLRRFEGPQDA
jgi:exosortase